jgi:hypothetical protein
MWVVKVRCFFYLFLNRYWQWANTIVLRVVRQHVHCTVTVTVYFVILVIFAYSSIISLWVPSLYSKATIYVFTALCCYLCGPQLSCTSGLRPVGHNNFCPLLSKKKNSFFTHGGPIWKTILSFIFSKQYIDISHIRYSTVHCTGQYHIIYVDRTFLLKK